MTDFEICKWVDSLYDLGWEDGVAGQAFPYDRDDFSEDGAYQEYLAGYGDGKESVDD